MPKPKWLADVSEWLVATPRIFREDFELVKEYLISGKKWREAVHATDFRDVDDLSFLDRIPQSIQFRELEELSDLIEDLKSMPAFADINFEALTFSETISLLKLERPDIAKDLIVRLRSNAHFLTMLYGLFIYKIFKGATISVITDVRHEKYVETAIKYHEEVGVELPIFHDQKEIEKLRSELLLYHKNYHRIMKKFVYKDKFTKLHPDLEQAKLLSKEMADFCKEYARMLKGRGEPQYEWSEIKRNVVDKSQEVLVHLEEYLEDYRKLQEESKSLKQRLGF